MQTTSAERILLNRDHLKEVKETTRELLEFVVGTTAQCSRLLLGGGLSQTLVCGMKQRNLTVLFNPTSLEIDQGFCYV